MLDCVRSPGPASPLSLPEGATSLPPGLINFTPHTWLPWSHPGRGQPAASPPFPAPPQTWRMAAGFGLQANGADSSTPSRTAATAPRPRSTAASLPSHLFFFCSSTTASGSHWRSPLLPAARSPQHRDPPQQRGLSDSVSLLPPGFRHQCNEGSSYGKKEAGTGEHLTYFNNKINKHKRKAAAPHGRLPHTKHKLKFQAWSSLIFHCRHSSFNPSEAPPWDSRPVSGAGVVHYHLLHRPRSVPTALGPAPLATDALKVLYGPRKRAIVPVRLADGSTLFKVRHKILARWANHFESLFNHTNPADLHILDNLPDLPPTKHLDTPPLYSELRQAIAGLKNNKCAGPDGIPAEVFKHGGYILTCRLHLLIQNIWEYGTLPQDWKDANIVVIYKQKGDRAVCGNSRGISLLSIAGKVLAKIMLSRLVEHISEAVLPETQCGFRKSRSTTDMVFVLRQLTEKSREQNKDLYVAFINLSKAFDTINRELLWKKLCPYAVPLTRKYTPG